MRTLQIGRSVAILLTLLLPAQAFAVTRTWDGGGANTNWGTAANWSGDTVPGGGDDALFDGTSSKDATIPTTRTIRGIEIRSSYTGNVTQSGGAVLTVGTGSFIMGGGTFRGGTGSTVLQTNLTLSGGTLIAPEKSLSIWQNFTKTGGTYTPNHGTLVMNPRNAQTLTPNGARFDHIAINDGLLGYWKFDEGSGLIAYDSSGYSNSGSLKNGAVFSATVPTTSFKNSYSTSFDGVNDFVYMGAGRYPLLKTNPFSGMAWVKTLGTTGTIFSNWTVLGNAGWQFTLGDGGVNGGLNFIMSAAGGSSVRGKATTTAVNDNQWHHVAFTYDGSNTAAGILIYIDGISQTLISRGDNDPGTLVDTGFAIGARSPSAFPYYFGGSIDDVRIYNRALSATEIARLAAGNQPQTSSGSVTLAGNLALSGSLLLNAGTLDVSTSLYSITASGSWLNHGGIFTPRTGTVTLEGASPTLQSGGQSFSTLIISTAATVADAASVTTLLSIGLGAVLALPSYALTATLAVIANLGTITETLGGGIIHPASLSISPTTLTIGSSISISLTDTDENIDGTARDTVVVYADDEAITLTETAVDSGVFQGSVATAHGTPIAGNAIIENNTECGILVTVGYSDAQDSSDIPWAQATVSDPGVSCEQGGGGGGSRPQPSVYVVPSIHGASTESIALAQGTVCDAFSSSSTLMTSRTRGETQLAALCRRRDVILRKSTLAVSAHERDRLTRVSDFILQVITRLKARI